MKKRRNVLQSGKTSGKFAISSPGQTAKTKTTKGAPLFSVPKWALLCKQQTKQPNKLHSPRKRIKQTIKQTRAVHNRHLPCQHSGNAHDKTVLFLTQSAVIAALYIVFTMVSAAFGLSSGVIQVRISEAMCILPAFTPAAIPGLTIGCFIANLLSGGVILDAVFGGLATLLGAVGAYLLGRVLHKNNLVKGVVLSLPNLVANTLIVPWVLYLVYQAEGTVPYFMLTVGAGELIAGTILGAALFIPLARAWNKLPQKQQLK